MKGITTAVAILVLASIAGAQTAQELVAANKLSQALQAAGKAAAAGEDVAALQVLGILQLATGDAQSAEKSFDKAVTVGVKSSGVSGLEEAFRPGTALSNGLRLQKTALAPGVSAAALLNNRGAARLLLGRLDEAAADFDQAATVDAGLAEPWLNGALVAIEKEDFPQAEKNARVAMSLGLRDVRAHTTLAETQFLLGRADRAEDALRSAFEIDPFYPFALLVKARVDLSQNRVREAERALTQALAAGPSVVVDSKLARRAASGSIFGGIASEAHLRHLERGYRPSSAFRFGLEANQQHVEGRSDADQFGIIGGLSLSSSLGVLHLEHYRIDGGKPGAEGSVVGISPNDEADFRLRETRSMLLKPIDFGTWSRLWLHANYSTFDVYLNTDTSSSYTKSLAERQWLGEARWDIGRPERGLTQIGATYATLRRTGQGPRPIEPSEQSMPLGNPKIWTAYAIHRQPLTDRATLTFGAMAGAAAGQRQTQPLLDLALKASGSRTIHLRATPRFNDSISNLIPIDVVADSPQRNLIDRNEFSTQRHNRNTILQGTRSRQLDFELAINDMPTPKRRLETVLFNRTLNNINVQSADPRVATSLLLTPVEEGVARGIEGRATFVLSDPWSVRMLVRYQETTADFANPTLSQESYPSQVPMSSRGLPNFPQFQGVASLDYAKGPWVGRLMGIFAGARPTAITAAGNNGPVTYLGEADAQFTGHLLVDYKINRNSNAVLRIFNLGEANFYPGYPGRITAVLGYDYRF